MPLPRLTFVPAAQERKSLTRAQRRFVDDSDLKFRTNMAILIAVALGVAAAACRGGNICVSVVAFGAALGLGGVLGFLFGVPAPGSTRANETLDHATLTLGDRSVVNVQAGPTNAPETVTTGPPAPPAGATPAAQGLESPIEAASLTSHPGIAASAHPAPAPHPPSPPPAPSHPVPNASNLEQVADWVTKLLLGGGLTQMSKIPPKVWQWSHAVAIGILDKDAVEAKEAIVTAVQAFAAGLLIYGFILGFFAGFLITKIQLGKAISS